MLKSKYLRIRISDDILRLKFNHFSLDFRRRTSLNRLKNLGPLIFFIKQSSFLSQLSLFGFQAFLNVQNLNKTVLISDVQFKIMVCKWEKAKIRKPNLFRFRTFTVQYYVIEKTALSGREVAKFNPSV